MTIQNLKGKRFDTIFYISQPQVIKVNLNSLNIEDSKNLNNISINKS